MSLSDPCLIRSRGSSGQPVPRLGMPHGRRLSGALEGRCRPNTVLAVAPGGGSARRLSLRVLPDPAQACPSGSRRTERAARASASADGDRFSDWYPRPDWNRRYRLKRGIHGSADSVENH
jgi:hypothetical protein